MLPINLLPNYIFDKNKKRNAFIAYGLAIAAVAAIFIVWSQGVQAKLNAQKDRLAVANDRKSKYDGVDKNIKDVQNKIAQTKTKQTFIANAQTWNDAWPTQYDQLRNLTSPYVLLKSMFIGPDRKTVKMTGFAANEQLIAKWWIALKNQKEIFSNISIQLPTHPFVPEGAANAAGGGGMRGMGGFPGSGGGPMASGMSGMGGVGMPGMPGSGGMGMRGGMPGMPGSGGMGGGGGANSAEVGPAMIEDRPGINFVVTAVLKNPVAASVAAVPSWPAGAAPAGGGMGGFSGAPGMPGSGGMGGPAGMPGSGGMGGGRMGKGGAD